MKKLIGLVLLLSMVSVQLKAQETEVEVLFKKYIKLINDLNETKDDEALIALFSKDFKSLITTTALNGQYNTITGDLERQKKTYRTIMRYETMDANLKILDISNVSQNDAKGTLTATLSSVIYIDGKEHEKNSYRVDVTIRKDENENWLFNYFYVDRTLEERKRGVCVAYFYERLENYIVEINYPAVSSYKKEYYPFHFEFYDDIRKIREADHDYLWNADNTVMYEMSEQKIEGTAKTKKEAVGLILQNYYKDQCYEILLR